MGERARASASSLVRKRAPVVLITGASSGIGKACAEACAAAGMKVYGTSRRAAKAARAAAPDDATPSAALASDVAATGAAAQRAGYRMIAMDVTDEASVRDAVAYVLAAEARLDAVVNNAGFGIAGAVEDTSLAEAARQFETNFFGVLRVCQAVLPAMREARSGRIINVGSLGGAMGLPFQGLYSASKFAIEGLTESLRHEVARYGIEVTVIQAGDVSTAFTENRVRAAGSSAASSVYGESFERALKAQEREEQRGIPPALVGLLVQRLIHTRKLRVRYPIGKLSRLSLVAKSILPSRWFERALGKYFDL